MTAAGCHAKLHWRADNFGCDGVAGHPGLHACLIEAMGRESGHKYEVLLYWDDAYEGIIKPWQVLLNKGEIEVEMMA